MKSHEKGGINESNNQKNNRPKKTKQEPSDSGKISSRGKVDEKGFNLSEGFRSKPRD